MALPIEQVLREQRFIAAHPQWRIYRLGDRFSAECAKPNRIVAKFTLPELLDRLDEIVAEDAGGGQ